VFGKEEICEKAEKPGTPPGKRTEFLFDFGGNYGKDH
jgi:hypothetical protein